MIKKPLRFPKLHKQQYFHAQCANSSYQTEWRRFNSNETICLRSVLSTQGTLYQSGWSTCLQRFNSINPMKALKPLKVRASTSRIQNRSKTFFSWVTALLLTSLGSINVFSIRVSLVLYINSIEPLVKQIVIESLINFIYSTWTCNEAFWVILPDSLFLFSFPLWRISSQTHVVSSVGKAWPTYMADIP